MCLAIWTIGAFFALFFVCWFALEVVSAKKGDCRIAMDPGRIRDVHLYIPNEQKAFLEFVIPFVNTGSQQGLIIDCTARIQPDGDRLGGLETSCALQNLENPGLPWYWQAFILKEKRSLDVGVRVSLESCGKPLTEYLKNLEKLRVDLYYKYYGRALLANRRQVVEIPLGDLSSEGKYPPRPPAAAVSQKEKRRDARAITVKTHLLRPGDDLAEVIRHYFGGELKPGDIVAVAESVVAIIQGRAFYVEDIHPRLLARKLSRLFDKDSSLSSPYALEMAIREVGTARIILAFLLGGLGKIFGRKGDFYRLAGRAVATIDDCTGTIPPYDKYVVLGPAEGQDVVRKLKASLGVDAVIVDANDLGKVDILASTAPEKAGLLTEVLAKNPQGNAEEQTPIVIVRDMNSAST